MKRLTTLFLSCVVCAGVALAQDAKPLKAVYTGKLLEQSEQVGIRGAARVQADAVLAEDFSKFTKGTEADPDDEASAVAAQYQAITPRHLAGQAHSCIRPAVKHISECQLQVW